MQQEFPRFFFSFAENGMTERKRRRSRNSQSSLAFFYRVRSGTVDLDKDRYLTPAPDLRGAGASHESQCAGCFAYGDALGGSFFPGTVPVWSGLPSSVVSSRTVGEFGAQVWITGAEVCVLACLCTTSCG